jgi:hypothetical protein
VSARPSVLLAVCGFSEELRVGRDATQEEVGKDIGVGTENDRSHLTYRIPQFGGRSGSAYANEAMRTLNAQATEVIRALNAQSTSKLHSLSGTTRVLFQTLWPRYKKTTAGIIR